jgi:hypothetical protein
MNTHKDVGRAAVPLSDGRYIQCILCECGAFVRPHEWREHIAAVEALSAKRDAEAAVVEAAKVMADFLVEPSKTDSYNEYLDAKVFLLTTVAALRALEEDA